MEKGEMMRIACLCMVMGLFVSGCATTGKVDQMIDSKVAPQIEQITAQLEGQNVAAAATLEDMKVFVDRLGRTLNQEVASIQSGVDGLKSQLGTLKADTAGSKNDVKGVKAEISKMDSSISSLSRSVDSLKGTVKKLGIDTAAAQSSAQSAADSAARLAGGSSK